MVIGCLRVHLLIHDSWSLKDKRSVISGLRQRIRNRYNVSIAEVDDLDLWNSAVLAVAAVANEKGRVETVLRGVMAEMDKVDGAEVVETHLEWY